MPPSPSSLTIRQLAKLAGVSKSTASLAMQNHPRLSKETRERVRKIAAEQGYAPDPLTSVLMNRLRTARKRRSVEKMAYLTSWNRAEEWRKSENDTKWYEGARARALALGYELEHIWAREPGLSAARLSKVLYTRAIRGLIIAPLLRPRGHLSLDWQHLAAATIGFTVVKPDIHRATHSHHNGMILALRRLRHLGYRRIGLANLVDQIERVSLGWLAGYLVYEHGLPAKQRVPALLQKGWDKRLFAAWLEKYQPDAVISNMIDPLLMLKELGHRVPQDIGYANLDIQMELQQKIPVAGIDQQQPLVGAATVDLVAAQLQQNEYGLPICAKTVSLEGIWCDGPTARRKHGSRG